MAKDKKPKEGEQGFLIDVHDKNVGPIVKAAKLYKEFQLARIEALNKEKEQKQKVLELIKEANLQRLENGVIKFEYEGVLITVEPRDDLIKVKDNTDE